MGSSDITNVYAALDRTHTIVALERSRRGDEGFRTFFDEFADYAANKGYIPYLLLLTFTSTTARGCRRSKPKNAATGWHIWHRWK